MIKLDDVRILTDQFESHIKKAFQNTEFHTEEDLKRELQDFVADNINDFMIYASKEAESNLTDEGYMSYDS